MLMALQHSQRPHLTIEHPFEKAKRPPRAAEFCIEADTKSLLSLGESEDWIHVQSECQCVFDTRANREVYNKWKLVGSVSYLHPRFCYSF